MPYIRPPLFVRRVFNPIAMRFGIGGSQALTVRRRSSGTDQRIPVIPVEHDGALHIVCPRGETDWVKNIRASGRCRLGPNGNEPEYIATEIPVDERAEIITRYRAVAGRAVRSFFEQLPDDRDHPTFRLTRP